MVGILAQVDDIFSWASRGGCLIGAGRQAHYKATGTLGASVALADVVY